MINFFPCSFWKESKLNGKSLLLKNWIPDRILDISLNSQTGLLRVISTAGIHSCRVLKDDKSKNASSSSASSSSSKNKAVQERFSSYFSKLLCPTAARFLNGSLLAFGMSDGDLYLTEEGEGEDDDALGCCLEKEEDAQFHLQGRRFNSSAIRAPVKSIEAVSDDLLLVSYKGGKS